MVFFLLQSVQSVVGRASYDFVGALLSLWSVGPFVHASVRPPAYALTRAHLYSSTFFTYCLLFVGVVYSSRSWTLGHDNTAVFDFIFRLRIWFDFWLECVPHLKLEIDIRFLRITLISSESGGRRKGAGERAAVKVSAE